MSWITSNTFEEYKQKASRFLSLPPEEQNKITFTECRSYVLPDTLHLAMWDAIEKKAMLELRKPAEALKRYAYELGVM